MEAKKTSSMTYAIFRTVTLVYLFFYIFYYVVKIGREYK